MSSGKKIRLPWSQVATLVCDYVRQRFMEQLRAVAFIVIYLAAFQMLVLNIPIRRAASLSFGLGMAVLGLAFFLEGVRLGLMPLGELVGARLPRRTSLPVVMFFAFILGTGATFAEPALAILKMVGSGLLPWDAPALYHLLNVRPDLLLATVAAGVGGGVAVGIIRFYRGWSLKPLVVLLTLPLLALSAVASFDPRTRALVGLAWDVGAVTTGPVTVPLVLALGLGVCLSVGKISNQLSGFGLITMASLGPNILVLLLGMHLAGKLPEPMKMTEFFEPARREAALAIVGSEEAYKNLRAAHVRVGNHRPLPVAESFNARTAAGIFSQFAGHFQYRLTEALLAVVPLAALLLIVSLLLLRARPEYGDEVGLGIVMAIIGMTFLATGNQFGLTRLGNEVGGNLPAAFERIDRHGDFNTIANFDRTMLGRAVGADGKPVEFFSYYAGGEFRQSRFEPENYDPDTGEYHMTIKIGPIFDSVFMGLLVVMFFAWMMGYGATIAEPSLRVMGDKVEEATAGVVKQDALVRAVSIGVGIGMIAGVARIFWHVPIVWLLAPPYLLLIPLTLVSEEKFVNFAWDAAGVTTGPVTVPLVLAMGLGIGRAVGVGDGFGVLALASVYPILTVLLMGLLARRRKSGREPRRPQAGGPVA